MTQIWYEVFPVTLVDGQAMLLQDTTRPMFSPWMLSHQSHMHPNMVVIEHMQIMLGRPICPEKTIVHSTSWRYDASQDWMLLTYLAIFPQIDWSAYSQPDCQMTLEPVGTIAAHFGDQLFPPGQIACQEVLAHALDHLAALNTYDPGIQATLEAGWCAILSQRQPKPAGCLQRLSALELTSRYDLPVVATSRNRAS